MLKKLLIGLAVVAALFFGVGLFLPSKHAVERSINIERPAATVFTLLNSYHAFNEWSPWAELDPNATYVRSGPESGVGARLSWSGDPRLVGTGWQEITASLPYERIESRLDFGPQGAAESYFDLQPGPDGVRVSWGFQTDVTAGQGLLGSVMGRYFGLFLDRWVGADYERGLEQLKAYAESLPAIDVAGGEIEVLLVEAAPIVYLSGATSQDATDVAAALASAYRRVTAFIDAHGLQVAGAPMAITRAWDEFGYRFDAAIPVSELADVAGEGVQTGYSPAGRAARIIHRGPYEELLASYERLAAYMTAHGLPQGALSWEVYVSDPAELPPERLETHIYVLIAD